MPADIFISTRNPEMSLRQKIWQINWGMMLLLSVIAGIGFAMLYSAAGGSLDPWASRQMVRFGGGTGLMLYVALIDIRFWFRYAYPLSFFCLFLLVAVAVTGASAMGPHRWRDLRLLSLQPSE